MNDSLAPGRARLLATAAVLAATLALGGCTALVIGSAVIGGALIATDRRSSGTQIDDQAIELKARSRIREAVGDRGHVVATSYNRVLLLTGEVPGEPDKFLVGQAVGRIDGVKSVVNELAVAGNSSLASRSNDAVITGRVKTALVDAKDVMANSIKVVTERGTVYLMGRVTEREAARAADIARTVRGVQKVVRVFELLSEAELQSLGPPAAAAASVPAARSAAPPAESPPRR